MSATMKPEKPESDDNKCGSISTPEDIVCMKGREDIANESSTEQPETLYCILSEKEKILTICTCSLVTLLGPMSASMYLPTLGSTARDMHVPISKINLTITSYKACSKLGMYLIVVDASRFSKLYPLFLLPGFLIRMAAARLF
jgi:hypothetical protein